MLLSSQSRNSWPLPRSNGAIIRLSRSTRARSAWL